MTDFVIPEDAARALLNGKLDLGARLAMAAVLRAQAAELDQIAANYREDGQREMWADLSAGMATAAALIRANADLIEKG